MTKQLPIKEALRQSVNAADAADRLRLIVTDLRLIDLAVQRAVKDDDDREALVMHLRRLVSDAEMLKDDVLERDRKGGTVTPAPADQELGRAHINAEP